MKDKQILVRDLLLLLAFAGWALALPHYGSEFVVSMALTCLMYVALSSSWGLFCGSTRYLSLATSAFFGIGAYTSAIALEKMAWLESIALGAGIATVVAVVMGAAVLHLRGTYFAVLTFGMTELIRHAVTYFEKKVTGTVGRVLTVVPDRDTIYLTVLALAVLAVLVSIIVRRSRFDYGVLLHKLGLSHLLSFTQRFGYTPKELEDSIRKGIRKLNRGEAQGLARTYVRAAELKLGRDDLAGAVNDLEAAALWDPEDPEIPKRVENARGRMEAVLKSRMAENTAALARQEYSKGNVPAIDFHMTIRPPPEWKAEAFLYV